MHSSPVHPARRHWGIICGMGLLAFSPAATARITEVTAVADMTAAGRKLVHPDPDHPALYIPVMFGFTEEGGSVATGEQPPPANAVAKLVAEALARQGYLLAHPGLLLNKANEVVYGDDTVLKVPAYPRPDRKFVIDAPSGYPLTKDMLHARGGAYSLDAPVATGQNLPSPLVQVLRHVDPVHGPVLQGLPSLVIAIRWGDLHPDGVAFQSGQVPVRFNLGLMISLVAGDSFDQLSRWDKDEVLQRTRTDRYFVIISAYELASLLKGKQILLWSTKMSVPSNLDAKFDKMLPLLLSAGEPHLGRSSDQPELTTVNTAKAEVTIGVPKVKDEGAPKTP